MEVPVIAEIFCFIMGFALGVNAISWWVLRLMKKLGYQ